jgi:hypothetical protein
MDRMDRMDRIGGMEELTGFNCACQPKTESIL